MATVPQTEIGSARPLIRPDSQLFRFRLRHLFFFVTAVSLLLAVIVGADAFISGPCVLGFLIVGAHILSTVIGTRLRDGADRANGEGRMTNDEAGRLSFDIRQLSFSPPVLHGRCGVPFLRLFMLVAGGALAGGVGGAVFLERTIGDRMSLVGLAVGALSMAVLGGWTAFLASNFYRNMRNGLREALNVIDE